jgi:hypothetical protein
MPQKRHGEKLSDFIGRFVANDRERRKFPNVKQRLAVGYAEARQQARKQHHG